MSARASRHRAARLLAWLLGATLLPAVGWAAGPAGATGATGSTGAGGDAEVRRMIDSLKPSGTAPRTRNLVIEPAAPRESAAAATPPPPSPPPSQIAAPTPAPAPPAAPAAAQTSSSATPAAPAPPSTQQTAQPPTQSPGLSLAIGFEPNSAQLHPDSGATLGALVAAMLSAELAEQRFMIEGHTDASGSPAQNLRLSRERAEQVRLFLVTLGVAAERLRTVGKGSSEPANASDPRSPENRRVRVVALP